MKEIIYKYERKVIAVCPKCGTVFSYTGEDTKEVPCLNQLHSKVFVVTCPNCEHELYVGNADNQMQYIYPPDFGTYPPKQLDPNSGKIWWNRPIEQIPCSNNPCNDCDFYKRVLTQEGTYVGDVPCNWCANSPYKVTSQMQLTLKGNTATATNKSKEE